MPNIITPDDLIFGTPTSIKYGGVEVGATLDPPVVTITPTLYKPDFQNAVGPVMGAVFISGAEIKAEVTVNEFTATKLAWGMPGATEVGGIVTWAPGRVALDAFQDLVLIGSNLAGNPLTITVKNALPEGAISISMSKSELSGMKLTFIGYVDGADPQTLPFEIELGGGS
jgi:hypothetical protein